MRKVRLTVGGDIKEEVSRRAIDAWHRAERGETFHERHLAFENWDTLARVLSNKRMELLGYVRRNKSPAFAHLPRRWAAITATSTRMCWR